MRRVAPVVEAEDSSAGITRERQEICRVVHPDHTASCSDEAAEVRMSQEDRRCTRLKISSAILGTYTRQYPTAGRLAMCLSLLQQLSGNPCGSRSSTHVHAAVGHFSQPTKQLAAITNHHDIRSHGRFHGHANSIFSPGWKHGSSRAKGDECACEFDRDTDGRVLYLVVHNAQRSSACPGRETPYLFFLSNLCVDVLVCVCEE